jgi:hypothetical protein
MIRVDPLVVDACLGLIAAAASLWLWARILGVPHV